MKTALPLDRIISLIQASSGSLAPLPTPLTPSRTRLEGIKHIAFDIYGTLLVSGVGDIGNSDPTPRGPAIKQVLHTLGVAADPTVDLESLFLSAIRQNQVDATLKGAYQPEVDIREVWHFVLGEIEPGRSFSDEFVEEIALRFELAVNPVAPMPGISDTIKRLSTRFPPFSIVSNAQFFTPAFFPALLGKSLSGLHFDMDSCVWSFAEREAKPSPRLFEKLLQRIGPPIRSSQILYIGNDMLNDVAAATEAGLRTALFAGDRRSLRLREGHPRCEGLIPDLILTTLDQLPDLV